MKIQNIVNLIRYHSEKNDEAFSLQASEIAREFEKMGECSVSQYIMELISSSNYYVPQSSIDTLRYLSKIEYSQKPLLLPEIIEEDIVGLTKAVSNKTGLSKFLFYGAPGTGKTETAYQVARILGRDIFTVPFEQLVDSHLGMTAKNIIQLFEEIKQLPSGKILILLDEIDTLVLDRLAKNDLREMGRVTSTFLKCLDSVNDNVVIIATTNLQESLDKAMLRRFDACISFDRYSREDLIKIADAILVSNLKHLTKVKQDIRLFNKILSSLEIIPYPGILKQIIRTSVAFSDEANEYDYLRRIYQALCDKSSPKDIKALNEYYTTREIEILTRIPKSSVSRKLKEDK